jgi:hypothetical protein
VPVVGDARGRAVHDRARHRLGRTARHSLTGHPPR